MSGISALAETVDPLKKPVNTLAIVPQNKRITVLGRKAYNVMLCIAQEQGIEKETYRTLLADIVTGIDYGSNDLEPIKKHLRSMAATTVEWQSPTSGEGSKWSVCALIAHAELLKTRGQVWVEWSYAKPLKQELLEPSVFAKLSLNILSQMHTHAGIVLYEICTRYKAIGRTSRQNWRWWQPVLSGQPVSDRLAKVEYRFFKRDTLKPAIAEVCAITDIDIELLEHKEGKFISELQFLVQPKVQASLPLRSPPKPIDLSLIQEALRLGVPDETTEELIADFGEDAVRAGLKSLERRIATAFPEPLRAHGRYLKTMLAGDQSKVPLIQPTEAEQHAKKRIELKDRQSANKTAWNEEWLRRRRDQITEMLEGLSEQAIADLVNQLEQSLVDTNAHPSLIKRLRTSGWQHPMVKHLMIDFFAKATINEDWNQPTPKDLLDIASQTS